MSGARQGQIPRPFRNRAAMPPQLPAQMRQHASGRGWKMATVFVLLGSILGFFGGLVSWLAFDMSFVAALAIWIVSGPLAAFLAVAAAALPGRATGETTAEPALVKA
jgi:hypothetical protein